MSRTDAQRIERDARHETLWRRWRTTGDDQYRDRLCQDLMRWCRFAVRRYAADETEHHSDLLDAAFRGVVGACEHWRPGQGRSFFSFASNAADCRVAARASYLHSKDVRRQALGFSTVNFSSMVESGQQIPDDAPPLDDHATADHLYRRLVGRLNPQQRAVLDQRLTGATMREIAQQMGCTGSRVGQITQSIAQTFGQMCPSEQRP